MLKGPSKFNRLANFLRPPRFNAPVRFQAIQVQRFSDSKELPVSNGRPGYRDFPSSKDLTCSTHVPGSKQNPGSTDLLGFMNLPGL